MKTSRYTEEQMAFAPKQAATGKINFEARDQALTQPWVYKWL